MVLVILILIIIVISWRLARHISTEYEISGGGKKRKFLSLRGKGNDGNNDALGESLIMYECGQYMRVEIFGTVQRLTNTTYYHLINYHNFRGHEITPLTPWDIEMPQELKDEIKEELEANGMEYGFDEAIQQICELKNKIVLLHAYLRENFKNNKPIFRLKDGFIIFDSLDPEIFKYASKAVIKEFDVKAIAKEEIMNKNISFSDLIGLLLRYTILNEKMRIGGMLLAVPSSIYKFFAYEYGVDFEGFGSPINTVLVLNQVPNARHCSLYKQDGKFTGCLGEPFRLQTLLKYKPKRLTVNPTYDSYTIKNIMTAINEYMRENEATIFMVVPRHDEGLFDPLGLTSVDDEIKKFAIGMWVDALKAIMLSPYLASFCVMNKVFFKYQLLNNWRYKTIMTDTIFFILSNEEKIKNSCYGIKNKVYQLQKRIGLMSKGNEVKIYELPKKQRYWSKPVINRETIQEYFQISDAKFVDFMMQQIKENIKLNDEYDTAKYYKNDLLIDMSDPEQAKVSNEELMREAKKKAGLDPDKLLGDYVKERRKELAVK